MIASYATLKADKRKRVYVVVAPAYGWSPIAGAALHAVLLTGVTSIMALDTTFTQEGASLDALSAICKASTTPQESPTVIPPEPEVIKTGYEPERYLLQTYCLTARDPRNPVEPHITLHLYLENCRRDAEMLVVLLTNDDSISFICQVISRYFGEGYGITGCDRLS